MVNTTIMVEKDMVIIPKREPARVDKIVSARLEEVNIKEGIYL